MVQRDRHGAFTRAVLPVTFEFIPSRTDPVSSDQRACRLRVNRGHGGHGPIVPAFSQGYSTKKRLVRCRCHVQYRGVTRRYATRRARRGSRGHLSPRIAVAAHKQTAGAAGPVSRSGGHESPKPRVRAQSSRSG